MKFLSYMAGTGLCADCTQNCELILSHHRFPKSICGRAYLVGRVAPAILQEEIACHTPVPNYAQGEMYQ